MRIITTTNNSTALDTTMLKTHVKSNPRFKEAMTCLSKRERSWSSTSFQRMFRMMQEGGLEGLSKPELNNFFEVLQSAGAGYVALGRTPRFLWNFDLRSVALAALGLPDEHGNNIRADRVPPAPEKRRQPLPKITEATYPVDTPRSKAVESRKRLLSNRRDNSHLAATSGIDADSSVVIIQLGVAVFELDVTKVPKGAFKLIRFVQK